MISQPKECQNPPHFKLITEDSALAEVCAFARQQSAVALDTEFVRTRTLYPQLGLVQLYAGDEVALIDPTTIQDFSPFIALLADDRVTKVLHACGEDLEVFQHTFQQLPQPMCDTQVMANFLGFANSPGFATLVQQYFQIEIDKGASRTDWLARPLSDTQLRYAAADVWYLLPLYQQMQAQLAQTEWQSAVKNECEFLLNKRAHSGKDPDTAYFSIPNAWKLNSLELMRLKILAKWRMQEAMKRDFALNFVVRSENLWAVAKYNPKNTSALLELGLSTSEVRIHGKKLLQLLEQVKRIAPKDYPPMIQRLTDDPRYKTALKALQQKLREITPKNLPQELIASRRSLENLMKWHWLNATKEDLPELLQGWRKPFGDALLNVLKTL
ncbi:ribonuclease D [uncultured Aggregatibacter sp.]|uniref:ribonuclease D n=1 Tax=uncultured Aggregatibacter sp. TaxID=470564 RepID=UPI001A436442|nr:ribonuclease D [uncultured Aggregatibacter sp.]VTX89317.1 Ribonuclease D [uncultured Aggregatibacter sp.]